MPYNGGSVIYFNLVTLTYTRGEIMDDNLFDSRTIYIPVLAGRKCIVIRPVSSDLKFFNSPDNLQTRNPQIKVSPGKPLHRTIISETI